MWSLSYSRDTRTDVRLNYGGITGYTKLPLVGAEHPGEAAMGEKTPQVREQELLEERARLIGDWIRSDPALVQEIEEGYQAAERGKGVPAREYFEGRDKPAV